MLPQPTERCCLIKTGFQSGGIRLSEIHSAPSVVFAKTGRRRNTKYVFNLLAGIQLAPNDFNLAINAAISGDDEQANPGLEGGILHVAPCDRCLWD